MSRILKSQTAIKTENGNVDWMVPQRRQNSRCTYIAKEFVTMADDDNDAGGYEAKVNLMNLVKLALTA